VSIAINAWGWRWTDKEGIDNHDGRSESDVIVSDLLLFVFVGVSEGGE